MSKISADHLRRQAYVYVRQSTPGQVKNHLESKQLQYALAERATQLGWQAATVIDDDQGRSASGIHRVGFETLLGALGDTARELAPGLAVLHVAAPLERAHAPAPPTLTA